MRVASLLPAATEIVCALGGPDFLAGVSHECDYPAPVRLLPRLTEAVIDSSAPAGDIDDAVRTRAARGQSLYNLLEARIAAIKPEVILTQSVCDVCAVSEGDVRALASRLTPAPHVVTLDGGSLDGVALDIARVGEALDMSGEAAELIAGGKLRLRAMHKALKSAKAPRPRVAVIEWPDPVFNAGHWVPEMVHRAGGIDVLSSPGERSRRLSAPAVEAAQPDILLIAPCGFGLDRSADTARSLLASAEWRWARDRAIWAVDGNALVSRPGPRLIRGIEIFARVFHPALFGTPSARWCTRVA